MSNGSHIELPNPFTPMAFLPADLAYQLTVATYVVVGSLSVLIWDILTNLRADLKMLTHYQLRPSITVYFMSRLANLVYLLSITILQTSPIGRCDLVRRMEILFPFAISSTTLLFFFRVRAMYAGNNVVIGFFSFMWLAVVAASLTPIFGVSGSNIGITGYCLHSRLEPYVAAACIVPFVNDTFIFCATSWRLLSSSHVDPTIKNSIRVVVFGRHLPAFSKAILKDGQAYYLTIITLNLVTASLFFNQSIPIVYRAFIGVPNVVLMNAMACHVYRKVRFGIYKECATCPTNQSLSNHDGDTANLSDLIFSQNPSGHSHEGMKEMRSAADIGLHGTRLDCPHCYTCARHNPKLSTITVASVV